MVRGIRKTPFVSSCDVCGVATESRGNVVKKYCGTSCKEKARYERDREKRKEAAWKYHEKNRDKILAKNRERHRQNREVNNIRSKEYYLENREKLIKAAVQYQKDNPDVVSRRNARRKSVVSYELTSRDMKRMLHRHRGCCGYCGIKLTPPSRTVPTGLQWDHIVPLSRGGTNGVGNLIPSCMKCNTSKHNSYVMEWGRYRGWGNLNLQKALSLVKITEENTFEELDKARKYLDWEIERLEKE